jgi:hypothetical protein
VTVSGLDELDHRTGRSRHFDRLSGVQARPPEAGHHRRPGFR